MKRRCGILRSAAVAALLPLVAGCYVSRTLGPDEQGALTQGTEVEVRLTGPAAVRMADETGWTGRSLRGRLLRDADGALHLSVPRVREGTAVSAGRPREALVVPLSDVEAVEVRELSKVRTARYALAGAVGAYLLGRIVFGITGEASGERGGPPPGFEPSILLPRGGR